MTATATSTSTSASAVAATGTREDPCAGAAGAGWMSPGRFFAISVTVGQGSERR